MTERFFLVITLVAGLFLIIKLLNNRQLNKVKYTLHGLTSNKEKTPHIIYFWSPQCQQCQNMQKPVIDDLSHKFDCSIKRINIVEDFDIAKKWNVRTVPSTYILNSLDDIMFINNGFKSEKEILTQLEKL